MEERVLALGGTLNICSLPEWGTAVSVRLPLAGIDETANGEPA